MLGGLCPVGRYISVIPLRLVVLWVVAVLAPGAVAQVAAVGSGNEVDPGWSIVGIRPESAGRMTRFFGFEEETPNPVPDHWVRAQQGGGDVATGARAGFPPVNAAELDETMAGSGRVSVKLPTRGGSTSLLLSPGVVPVFSGADYRISAKVRTKGLTHARAVLVARLLDSASVPIAASESRSIPTLSEDGWDSVSVLLPGDFDNAAYLQIELQVLQPRELLGANPGRHVALSQDYTGAAWFDDVAVIQLAKIDLVCEEPSNVIVSPAPPVLRATIRDLTGEQLRGRVTVRDLAGVEVDSIEKVLGAGRAELTVTPKLPGLGWYRATFEVVSGGQTVGAARTDFVVLPARPTGLVRGSVDRVRLGVALGPMPDSVTPAMVAHLTGQLGAGAVSLRVWTNGVTRENAGERALAMSPMVDALMDEYRELTFVLAEAPVGSVSDSGTKTDVWALLEQDRAAYWPYLDQYLDRFGQRVRRWQIGEAGSETVSWRKNLNGDLGKFVREVGQLISGPTIGIGSRVEFDLRPDSVLISERGGAVASLVSSDLPSWAAGNAARAWAGYPKVAEGDLTLVMQRAIGGQFTAAEAVGDMSRKVIEAWISASIGAERRNDVSVRTSVEQPWDWSGPKSNRPMPTPEFAAWRTLVDQLTDRVAIGSFPAAPGVRCVILAPVKTAAAKRGGALVFWNESAEDRDSVVDAYLGGGELTLVDHFGNRTTLQKASGIEVSAGETVVGSGTEAAGVTGGERAAVSTVRVNATRMPAFIEGIDVELVRLIASVRMSPGFLPATTQRKDMLVEFDNPWPTAISGEITIVEPMGGGVSSDGLDRSWKIVPRVMRFAVKPGEHASLPVSVAFGGLEEAGRRDFVFSMDLAGEQRVKGIKIRAPVTIGLKHLKVDLSASLSPTTSGPDAVVEVQVTNVGESAVDLELTAFAPKRPRASATVGSLQPGQQSIRRFVFPGAAAALRGQKVLVSVTEPEGGSRLNSSVVVP
jgi:hypothetical protein